MVYGCANNTVKFLVFIFNFLICLAGAAIAGVGLWLNLDKNAANTIKNLVQNEKLDLPEVDISQITLIIWVLVGVGAFLFLTGFLGCSGALCEHG